MQVAITGSTGLIGTALVDALQAAGDSPIRVVRQAGDGIRWDPSAGTIDAASLEGVDAVVHLAGEGIGDKRWTAAQKRRIADSRVHGTTLLSETLANLERRPKVLLSASAIGFYGDRGDEPVTEQADRGDGFLADVCAAWEKSTEVAEQAGITVAHLRNGIVLSAPGGVLGKMLPLYRLGLGGRLGSGRQYMSWISLDDEVNAIRWLLSNPLQGAVNLTAPEPVTNREFTKTLAGALRRPAVMPVPRFAPKLLVGSELAEALLFSSTRVIPERLGNAGYPFAHPTLDDALRSILAR